jgi:hypothetical protein
MRGVESMGLLRLDFIDYTTEIEASVDEVFSLFKEIESWPTWTTAVKRAYRKPGGAWGVGNKVGFVPVFMPLPVEAKVLGYEEGKLVEWGIRSPVATIVHRFEFEPVSDDRCRVRHQEYAEGLFAILIRPMKTTIEEFDRKLADDLKAASEKR